MGERCIVSGDQGLGFGGLDLGLGWGWGMGGEAVWGGLG